MISYKVKARLFKNYGTDEFCFEEFEKVFDGRDNPIQARRKAYSYYESIIDIIDGNVNDESQVAAIYKPFIDFYEKHERGKEYAENIFHSFINNNLIEFQEVGVGIYFFSDDDKLLSKKEDFQIIGEASGKMSILRENLELEKKTYDLNNWETEGWNIIIKYYDFEACKSTHHHIEDPEAIIFSEVLWTPTSDFWWAQNPLHFKENDPMDIDHIDYEIISEVIERMERATEEVKVIDEWSETLNGGENRNLEFKSTLRFCLKTLKPENYIEYNITKAIVALANTEGGLLLIGVDDKGNVLGLENDINSFKKKSADAFLLHFDNLIMNSFTEPIDDLLTYGFETSQGGKFFMIKVNKSHKPRFLITKRKGKEFYIRRSASAYNLDIEETHQYIIDKWYS